MKIMDEEIYKIITDTYGTVFEPALRKQIEVRKKHASEGMDMALASFKKNPSAENFNVLKVAMLTYQYWVQKRVME
tara:strand:+ start:365 stop:592 length:228 start_codon:yes stop_codon:yes gene_type:complete